MSGSSAGLYHLQLSAKVELYPNINGIIPTSANKTFSSFDYNKTYNRSLQFSGYNGIAPGSPLAVPLNNIISPYQLPYIWLTASAQVGVDQNHVFSVIFTMRNGSAEYTQSFSILPGEQKFFHHFLAGKILPGDEETSPDIIDPQFQDVNGTRGLSQTMMFLQGYIIASASISFSHQTFDPNRPVPKLGP